MNPPVPLYDGLVAPGFDLAPRPGAGMPLPHGWPRLARDENGNLRQIGKKVNLAYDNALAVAQVAQDDIIAIESADDVDACQLHVTLVRPHAIPNAVIPIDVQNATGEFAANQLTVNYPGTGAPIIWPHVVARLEWGIGGSRTIAFVDFIEGATINLTASFLRVTPLVPSDAQYVPGTSGLYTLAGFVGPGFPRAAVGAQRTIFVGAVVAGAASAVVAVPPLARRATLVGWVDDGAVPAGVTAGYVQFYQNHDLTAGVGNVFVSGNQPGPFPIPSAAAWARVTNTSGIDLQMAAIFELAI